MNSHEHRKTLVFVPCYNDAASVSGVVERVLSTESRVHVLVVDDGSSPPIDIEEFRGRAVLVARLPGNYGLGVCSHVAMDHMIAAGYDFLVRVDADGQHPEQDIPRLLEKLRDGRADLVVASRTNDGGGLAGLNLLRGIMKVYLIVVSKMVTLGKSPSDVNSGFFALNRTAAEVLNREFMERYPEPQMFVSACRRGLKLSEIEVEQRRREHGVTTLGIVAAIRLFYRFNLFIFGEMIRTR